MFYEARADGYLLRIRVTPNASKCGICGIYEDSTGASYLKISLNAVPEKGKANAELIKFLSKSLKRPKSSFNIISGETERLKKLFLAVPPAAEIEQTLITMESCS